MVPPPTFVGLAAALDRAADLRPPVNTRFPASKGPTPTASSCGHEPRAPGEQASSGPRGRGPAGWCSWRLSGLRGVAALASPPAPGLEGKPGTPRSPCGAGWFAGWGRDAGSVTRQAPARTCSPCASLSRARKPESNAGSARGVDFSQGRGRCFPTSPGLAGVPSPTQRTRGRLRLARVPTQASAGGSGFPQHKMCLCRLTVGVTSISARRWSQTWSSP